MIKLWMLGISWKFQCEPILVYLHQSFWLTPSKMMWKYNKIYNEIYNIFINLCWLFLLLGLQAQYKPFYTGQTILVVNKVFYSLVDPAGTKSCSPDSRVACLIVSRCNCAFSSIQNNFRSRGPQLTWRFVHIIY